MNCAVHKETPSTAFCRTCGKAMCSACTHTVRGVVFCEECIAHRLSDTIPAGAPVNTVAVEPPPGTPSPGLAAVLGFIPGVGAMYNGQFTKAFIHVLIFASLVWAADREGFFGIFIPFFIFYMVFDAYKTAHARELGLPAPDPLGLERMFGVSQVTPGPVQPSDTPPVPGAIPVNTWDNTESARAAEAAYARKGRGPVGAVILIALGVLFLLSNLDIFNFDVARFWPVVLIAVGVWLFISRWNMATAAQPPTGSAPAETPSVESQERR